MRIEIKADDFARLEKAMLAYQGDVERQVNDVLHNQAGELIQEEIKRLMPTSGRTWKGKKKPAKTSNSLDIRRGNLSVTVATKTAYNYLYFPDDGTNTQRHVGNQRFFMRGAENKSEEIINLCIGRLVEGFEDANK